MNKQEAEWAATAAGYAIQPLDGKFILAKNPPKFSPHNVIFWNPLESDADAFRLMVDAGLRLYVWRGEVWGMGLVGGKPVLPETRETLKGDKAAATRKAIWDCAVEIGKELP